MCCKSRFAQRRNIDCKKPEQGPGQSLSRAACCLCFLALFMATACGGSGTDVVTQPPPGNGGGGGHDYSTQFPATENPISQGGMWINGGSTGNAWTNVATTPGAAFGTMPGNASNAAVFADSTAILTGSWGADQSVQATVFASSVPNSSSIFAEVEIRLRTSISSGFITGYEVNCSVSPNASNNYMQIVKWNGALADFTQLDGANAHCVNGDVMKATMVGNTITVFKNGTQMLSFTDSASPFTAGSPGMGFFLQGTTGVNQNYGFTAFSATDKP
jgi:hypothetical protein